jgi:Uma2 family endonuclease
MVNTQVRLTYEDYVELPDDKRYEIIDGELFEMSSPTFRHQEILSNLSGVLSTALVPGLQVELADVFAQD